MHSPALISFAQQLEAALLRGADTRSIRAEMAAIEQRERTAAAKAAAEERARQAETAAAEQAEIDAEAAALLNEIKARIEAKLAAAPLPTPMAIRRYPDGSIQISTED